MSDKKDEIIEWLEEDESRLELPNTQIGEVFGCNEGTARRAKEALEIKRLRATADAALAGENALKEILARDAAVDKARLSLAGLEKERSDLKTLIKELTTERDTASKAARERYPLFDGVDDENEGGPNDHRASLRMAGAV
jgi:hypothetical protein